MIPYKYKTRPYNHQIDATLRAFGHEGFALFCEMGTGKTKLSIDIVSNHFLQKKINAVLVIAPNGVHEQWYNEQVTTHCPVPFNRYLYKSGNSKKENAALNDFIVENDTSALKWLFVNVDRFSTENQAALAPFILYLIKNNVAIIIDEATRIKNPDSLRTRNICKMGKAAKLRYILTGTPITNSVFDLYSMVDFIRPGFWGMNYFIFKNKYGLFVRASMGGKKFNKEMGEKEFRIIRGRLEKGHDLSMIALDMGTTEENIRYIRMNPTLNKPYKHVDELKQIVAPISFQVLKKDCLDLPEKIYTTLKVEMTSDQKKIYQELKKNYMSEHMGDELSLQNKVSLALRLQQITGGFFPVVDPENNTTEYKPIGADNSKIDAMLEAMDEAGDQKIIVWARFIAEIQAIVKALKIKYPDKRIEAYYGGTPKETRAELVKDFQDGLIDVMVINPQSGAMGLNLQKATLHYYYSNTYSLEQRLQSEDRSHRIGQTQHVQYVDVVCTGTVDQVVLDALRGNREVLDYFRGENELF